MEALSCKNKPYDRHTTTLIRRKSRQNHLHLYNKASVQEAMTYFNPTEMELSYVMTKTPMPLGNYLAIQKVNPIDENSCKVTFTTYYNAAASNVETLQTTFDAFQMTFLENIRQHVPSE